MTYSDEKCYNTVTRARPSRNPAHAGGSNPLPHNSSLPVAGRKENLMKKVKVFVVLAVVLAALPLFVVVPHPAEAQVTCPAGTYYQVDPGSPQGFYCVVGEPPAINLCARMGMGSVVRQRVRPQKAPPPGSFRQDGRRSNWGTLPDPTGSTNRRVASIPKRCYRRCNRRHSDHRNFQLGGLALGSSRRRLRLTAHLSSSSSGSGTDCRSFRLFHDRRKPLRVSVEEERGPSLLRLVLSTRRTTNMGVGRRGIREVR